MRFGGPLLTPVVRRLPVGPGTSTVLRFSGFMFPTAKGSDVRRAVREFLTTPVDWYGHLAVAAAQHPQVPLSTINVPATFVAGRFDVLASHHDMRAAAERMDDATYVTLFGTHFLNLEKPKALTHLLRDFVERTAPVAQPPSA